MSHAVQLHHRSVWFAFCLWLIGKAYWLEIYTATSPSNRCWSASDSGAGWPHLTLRLDWRRRVCSPNHVCIFSEVRSLLTNTTAEWKTLAGFKPVTRFVPRPHNHSVMLPPPPADLKLTKTQPKPAISTPKQHFIGLSWGWAARKETGRRSIFLSAAAALGWRRGQRGRPAINKQIHEPRSHV